MSALPSAIIRNPQVGAALAEISRARAAMQRCDAILVMEGGIELEAVRFRHGDLVRAALSDFEAALRAMQ